jgi:uncharacterized protein (DUF39 family)
MSPEWLTGASILGYGTSLFVGVGIPVPVLDEEMARYAAVKDADIYAQVYDYSMDYPKGSPVPLAEVSYQDLRSGVIVINNKKVITAPMSSYYKANQIANILKDWIEGGKFLLGESQQNLPGVN